MRRVLLSLGTIVLSLAAFSGSLLVDAASVPDSLRRFADAPWDRATNAAVAFLLEQDSVSGYPDGTFRPNETLNRAEFLSMLLAALGEDAVSRTACFPDVASDAWYAGAVCAARDRGIVRGYPDGLFHPDRPVRFAEAAWMVARAFALPLPAARGDWFVPSLAALEHAGVSLPQVDPAAVLTRGQGARLIARNLALRRNMLDAYLLSERSAIHRLGAERSSRSRRSAASSPSSSSSSRRASSVAPSSFAAASSSPFNTDLIRSTFLPLGVPSRLFAGARFFSTLEPVHADAVIVTLAPPAQSIAAIDVFLDDGTFLGSATRTADAGEYRFPVASPALVLPHRAERSLFFSARVSPHAAGGVSGEIIAVQTVRLEGVGAWSGTQYAVDSSDVFPVHQTARARITSVTNAGIATSLIGPGADQMIAAFTVAAERSDALADVRILSLAFDIDHSAHFSITHAALGIAGSTERSACTVASDRIVCAAIPASIGRVRDTQTLRLYGDVAVEEASGTRRLRVLLDEPGFPNQPGDITWTDGTTDFSWLDLERPLAEGTLWR